MTHVFGAAWGEGKKADRGLEISPRKEGQELKSIETISRKTPAKKKNRKDWDPSGAPSGGREITKIVHDWRKTKT